MRLIDMDALCNDLLNRWSIADKRKEELIQAVMADIVTPIIACQPTINPEPHWIPCSEMEPKKSGHYLCTHGGTGIVSPDYYMTQEQAEELFADPEDEYLDLEEYIGWTSKNVIAWMPLPKAYMEERRTGCVTA